MILSTRIAVTSYDKFASIVVAIDLSHKFSSCTPYKDIKFNIKWVFNGEQEKESIIHVRVG